MRVRVDSAGGFIVRGDTVSPPAERMLRADGDLFLTADLLALLLGADVHVDFASLDVWIDPHAPLPAQLALEAQQRRQLALLQASYASRPVLPPTRLRPLSGAGVLHYSVSSALPDPARASVMMLESGFALGGGLAALGYTFSDGSIPIDPRLTFRYERFIPEREWISFVRAGDILAEGAFLRSMRGISVTNRPLRREQYFQDVVIEPDVPPGYEIEVYQGGQLIAYSDRTAHAPLRVPINYGRTDFEVRMIAPSGEVVTADLLYGVPQTQLPESAFEYSAGGGACHAVDCGMLFVSSDYGVRRWLTLGAGYEAVRDSADTEHLPFARASVAPAGGWLGEARVIGTEQASASLQFNGSGSLIGSLAVDVRSAEVPRATLLPQERVRWDTRGELGMRGRRAMFRLGGMEGDGVDRWTLGLIASIPRGVVIAQVEEFGILPTQLSVSGFQLVPGRWFGAAVTASARVGATTRGLDAVEGGGSASWDDKLFGNLTVGWDRAGGANLSLSFSRLLAIGQVAGVLSASDGGTRASLRGDGAIAVDPFETARPAGYFGVGFAGVDAYAFLDANGNGTREDGEVPAAGVTVRAGERSAVTDSTGHARIWGLLPWEKTIVRASPDWFDPQWAPAAQQQVIRPVAHMFNRVAIPLVGTREFVAYVVAGDGIGGTGGIRYRISNRDTDEVRDGLTLSDGSIYEGSLRVGRYRLELSSDDLRILRAEPVGPVEFTIGAGAGDDFVFELPPIEIERAGS